MSKPFAFSVMDPNLLPEALEGLLDHRSHSKACVHRDMLTQEQWILLYENPVLSLLVLENPVLGPVQAHAAYQYWTHQQNQIWEKYKTTIETSTYPACAYAMDLLKGVVQLTTLEPWPRFFWEGRNYLPPDDTIGSMSSRVSVSSQIQSMQWNLSAVGVYLMYSVYRKANEDGPRAFYNAALAVTRLRNNVPYVTVDPFVTSSEAKITEISRRTSAYLHLLLGYILDHKIPPFQVLYDWECTPEQVVEVQRGISRQDRAPEVGG